MRHKSKIAVIGTRGIPANYSGFETCVEETCMRWSDKGLRIRVYCRKGKTGIHHKKPKHVETIFVPYIGSKHFETFSHTFFSVLHLMIKRVQNVQVYGVGNGWFIPVLRGLGFHVVFVMDGLDWYRAKWGGFAKWILKIGARIGSYFAHYSVVDSNHVITRLREYAPSRQYQYIPYGANVAHVSTTRKLDELQVEKQSYFLFVGRFVPEKNVHLLIEAFEASNSKRMLVLVGGNHYEQSYENNLRATHCKNIIFTGFVFGSAYLELLAGCYAYVQPSALEGTSPALLAAMGTGACVLVSDIEENRETVGDAGLYFKSNDCEDLARMLRELEQNPQLVESKRRDALRRVEKEYAWNSVADRFLSLMSNTES